LTQPQLEEQQSVEELVPLKTFSGSPASVLVVLAQMATLALAPEPALVLLAAPAAVAAGPAPAKGSVHCSLANLPGHSWYFHLLLEIECWW
jgi:hypothetical protein